MGSCEQSLIYQKDGDLRFRYRNTEAMVRCCLSVSESIITDQKIGLCEHCLFYKNNTFVKLDINSVCSFSTRLEKVRNPAVSEQSDDPLFDAILI